jgi:hypothetical protein
MRRIRTEFRLNHNEKKLLNNVCKKYDLSFSNYIRRKLFDENEDLTSADERYVSPEANKHNLITVTMLHKLYYLFLKFVDKQELQKSNEDTADLDAKSLEYARQQRAKYGYEVIKTDEN